MTVARDLNSKTVKEKVRHLLQTCPETRDDDKFLVVQYMIRFCGLGDALGPEALRKFIEFMYNNDMPSFESIRRFRQMIQAKGDFQGKAYQARVEREEKKVRAWARKPGDPVVEDERARISS